MFYIVAMPWLNLIHFNTKRFIHLANNYRKILLIQLSWDQTGARLLHILDYQMVPILF